MTSTPRERSARGSALATGVGTMVLGRYGDTHIQPAPLFDPARAGPPDGAIDVQFRVPVSLSILLDGMAQAGLDAELAVWRRGFDRVAAEMAYQVQRACGYVADGERRDLAPARLEATAVVDDHAPGIATARWHVHVYVGPSAPSLLDGQWWPVAFDPLRDAVWGVAQPAFKREFEPLAVELLDVTWGDPRPGATLEIVDPPWHEHIDTADRGLCPGRWGPRRLVLADERSLHMATVMEADIARERAEGRAWTEPALYEPPPLPDTTAG